MQEMPDKTELKLSDAFRQPTEHPDVEVVAHMININYGHNMELMNRCRKLKEERENSTKMLLELMQDSGYTQEKAVLQLMKRYHLSEAEASDYVAKYWKK